MRRRAARPAPSDDPHRAILSVVESIPRGRVSTYGLVAERAGLPRRARLVGRVLSQLSAGTSVPWHRVVGAGGRIAFAAGSRANREQRARLAREGWEIVAPVPSCVLMFRQELLLMYPDDADVKAVAAAFRDPFEYLSMRHRAGALDTRFREPLGKVAWHVPCHQRVQNIGPKTREILELVPGTEVQAVERCSGHDGTPASSFRCTVVLPREGSSTSPFSVP